MKTCELKKNLSNVSKKFWCSHEVVFPTIWTSNISKAFQRRHNFSRSSHTGRWRIEITVTKMISSWRSITMFNWNHERRKPHSVEAQAIHDCVWSTYKKKSLLFRAKLQWKPAYYWLFPRTPTDLVLWFHSPLHPSFHSMPCAILDF